MDLTVDELLKGKATLIKNKEYLSTEAYVTPFLERMVVFYIICLMAMKILSRCI